MKSKKVTNAFISIQKYDRETLVNLILKRHEEFLNQNDYLIYFSTIWGKMQSGKTQCIDTLSKKYSIKYNHIPGTWFNHWLITSRQRMGHCQPSGSER